MSLESFQLWASGGDVEEVPKRCVCVCVCVCVCFVCVCVFLCVNAVCSLRLEILDSCFDNDCHRHYCVDVEVSGHPILSTWVTVLEGMAGFIFEGSAGSGWLHGFCGTCGHERIKCTNKCACPRSQLYCYAGRFSLTLRPWCCLACWVFDGSIGFTKLLCMGMNLARPPQVLARVESQTCFQDAIPDEASAMSMCVNLSAFSAGLFGSAF